jgi:uncharacterized protein (TIGR03663 family)
MDQQLEQEAGRTGRRTIVWWIGLMVLSAALHLFQLGDRTYHHDEAIHAHGSWVLLTEGRYQYDPTYHGPLLYYLSTASFALFGDSDFTARLPVALAGVSLVLIAWCLRRRLGEPAAWWTGLLATLSPITLYYGRFLRMDVLEMATASASAVAVWAAVAGGRHRLWAIGGVFAGLALATKENAYVTMALIAATWGVLAAFRGLHRSVPDTVRWLWDRRWDVLTAASVAAIVAVTLYTVFFTRPGDWFFPGEAIHYWWEQHSVQRVAGPPWYHLPRLAVYEFLPIGAALAWAVHRRRRMSDPEAGLLVFAILSVAMYCYLGEKVAWLGVHQVWAFLPLAGLHLARTFGPEGTRLGRGIAGLALAATLVVTVSANFVTDEISPNLDRVEFLTYVQSSPELLPVVAEGEALAAAGQDPAVAVAGDAGWPLSWYFRRVPVWWAVPRPGMRPPLVLCDVEQEAEVRQALGAGYVSERIPLRSWWVMEDFRPTVGEVARYVLTRRPWGTIGSTDAIVLRRQEGPVDPVQAVEPPAALAEALGVDGATLWGQGWLSEPRGLAVREDGLLAVADAGLSRVVLLDSGGEAADVPWTEPLSAPEDVVWLPGGVLAVADTWNHRVMLWRVGSEGLQPLPVPDGGWYGPRALAAGPGGRLAVTDTGNKRLVFFGLSGGPPRPEIVAGPGSDPGALDEPGGVAFLDQQRVVVCDTGNRRLQVLDVSGRSEAVVPLPDAWEDYYARPQVAVLDDGRWVASDPPAGRLWIVDGGNVTTLDLAGDGIRPAGLWAAEDALWMSDLAGRVWRLELAQPPEP